MKILIVGYGSIGQRHVQVLKNISALDDISLVTSRKDTGLTTYEHLEHVPHLSGFDYFIISSPTYLHAAQLSFLEQQVHHKRILVEKPLSHTLPLFAVTHNAVFVGYNLRFHPVLQALRDELSGQTVLSVTVHAGQYLPFWRPSRDYTKTYSSMRAQGGGVLLDLSHEIDYVQWLFGHFVHIEAENTKISDLQIDCDDILTAFGRTVNNIIVSMSLDYLSRIPQRTIVVHTHEKTIIGDLIHNTIVVSHGNIPHERAFPDIDRNMTYMQMHKAILSHEKRDVCTFQEGLLVLDTIEKIRHAHLKKAWV